MTDKGQLFGDSTSEDYESIELELRCEDCGAEAELTGNWDVED